MIRIPLTLFMGINDPIFCGSHIKRLFSTSVAILPAGLVQRITCDRICTYRNKIIDYPVTVIWGNYNLMMVY